MQKSIQRICDNVMITEDGQTYAVDSIIFATGFKTTEFLVPINIEGIDGKNLHQEWQGSAEAYKGITIAGFPNLFLLYGPNTNLGHNSIIFMVERQVHYILQCIRLLSEKNLKFMNLRSEIQRQYNQKLQTQAEKTVWSSNCTSWYKTANGKIVNNWPRASWYYFFQTRKVEIKDFEVEYRAESSVSAMPMVVTDKH